MISALALRQPGDADAGFKSGTRVRARPRGPSSGPMPVLVTAASRQEEPTAAPEAARPEGAAARKADGPVLAGLRVLVVEDEALVALELEDLLCELGAEVVGMALDADEAVRLAGAHRPDFVTMDIRIQGDRDGIAAATEIWALYGIRSVLVSAYGEALTLARASPANPIGLVSKPVSKARLAAALAGARR